MRHGYWFACRLNPDTVTTGASQYACELDAWVSSSATTEGGVLELWYNSVNATFTTPSVSGLRIMQPMIGTGNTITNYYGIRVDNQGAQGVGIVNNYGIYIFSQSGATTTNIGLYNAGTTQLQGAAAFGTAPIASQVTFGMNVRQTSGDATFLRGGFGGGTDPAYDLRVNGSIYVGPETYNGHQVLRIEYYPRRLYDDDGPGHDSEVEKEKQKENGS